MSLPNDITTHYRTNTAKVVVERLRADGSNYPTWHSQMETALMLEGVGEILKDKLQNAPAAPATEDEPATPVASIDLNEAKIKDAYLIIYGACSQEVQQRLAGFRDGLKAQDAWNFLVSQNNATMKAIAYQATQDFNADRFDEETDTIQGRYDRLLKYKNLLDRTPNPITEKQIVGKMSDGLPECLAYFALEAEKKDVAIEALQILQEGEMRTLSRRSKGSVQALYATKGRTHRKPWKPKHGNPGHGREGAKTSDFAGIKKKSGTCFYCKQEGHWKKECPRWRNMKKLKETIVEGDQDTKSGFSAAFAATNVALSNESTRYFYLDSGATSHLCKDKGSFIPSTLKRLRDPIEILLADGSSKSCQQTGSIKLKGTHGILHLKDVLYVPGLTINLVSTDRLNAQGYDILLASNGRAAVLSGDKRLAEAVKERGMRRLLCMPESSPGSLAYAVVAGTQGQLDQQAGWPDTTESGDEDDDNQMSTETVQEAITQAEMHLGNRKEEVDHLELWHRRFGHSSKKTIQRVSDDLPGYKRPKTTAYTPPCVSCLKGKMHQTFCKATLNKADAPLHRVHSDLSARMFRSRDGLEYFQLFVDEFTRRIDVAFCTFKAAPDCQANFAMYKVEVEGEMKSPIRRMRDDRGTGEFMNEQFRNFLIQHRIFHEPSPPYKKSMNGIVERTMRTVLEMARVSRIQAGLPENTWPWCVEYAVYTINRTPKRLLDYDSPLLRWRNRPIKISHLRPFGCKALVYKHTEIRQPGKWDARAWEGIFIGYQGESIYKVYNPATDKVYVSADVKFVETEFPGVELFADKQKLMGNAKRKMPLLQPLQQETQPETLPGPPPETQTLAGGETGSPSDTAVDGDILTAKSVGDTSADGTGNGPLQGQTEQAEATADIAVEATSTRKSGRARAPKTFFGGAVLTQDPGPRNLADAFERDAEGWGKAVVDELHSMHRLKVWEPVQGVPKGKKQVSLVWVLKEKLGSDGKLEKLKARLCSRGFELRPGIDYDQIFAPAASMTTARMFLAIAAKQRWKIEQLDVETAFLNAPLEEEVYIQIPEGIEMAGIPEWENASCFRLRRAMYGLNQSPRAWYKEIRTYLTSMGLHPSEVDPTLFFAKDQSVALILYVDDMLVAGQEKWVDMVKAQLRGRYSMKELGPARKFIGLEIERDIERGWLKIHQREYIQRLLQTYSLQDCNPVRIPIPSGGIPPADAENVLPADGISKYRSIVGALLWLSTSSRPDIAFTVSKLARYFACPTKFHLQAAKHVLRYLKGTLDHGIVYGLDPDNSNNGQDLQIEGYTDSDWGQDKDNRRSTSGFVFTMNGGAISWRSKLQQVVAQSTMEAEYMALAYAARETLWLRSLIKEYFPLKIDRIPISIDNKAAVDLANDQILTDRSKHISIRYHRIRELVKDKVVELVRIPTKEMVADICTKGLPKATHEKHCQAMSLLGQQLW